MPVEKEEESPLLNKPYQDSQVGGGSLWWVMDWAPCQILLGPAPALSRFSFLFCPLMDARVRSIPNFVGNRHLVWAGGFCCRKGWLVPSEMWATQARAPTPLQDVVGIRMARASLSSANFCLHLLSACFLLCQCEIAFSFWLTLSVALSFCLPLGGAGPLWSLDTSPYPQWMVVLSLTWSSM